MDILMVEYVITKPNGAIWDFGVISLEEMQGCAATLMGWMPGYQITMRAGFADDVTSALEAEIKALTNSLTEQ
jgi:hypothetical protein